ncbi:MAG: M14/M99 family metallopeptidase [Thermodesulfobacteriota bacterium]
MANPCRTFLPRSCRLRAAALLLVVLALAGLPAAVLAQGLHEVFLAGTEHELHVYRILGHEPGKTIMLIGGIQGDEPGGYLTADLYADVALKRGNLIVVPRANFYSILLNRREGRTGDMNRKFSPQEAKTRSMEEEVVAVLKHLIAESDCLLNLHEGSGYYAPTWISDNENPKRFGQSIIFDAARFPVPAKGRTVELEVLATRVAERVNTQLDNPRHRFRPNNHNTLSEASLHKEQRTSATYYALTQAHIPAFGVETSKDIDTLETKIRLHKLVINTFMEELGIELEAPGVVVDSPRLEYVLIQINAGLPLAVPNGARLEIAPGDEIQVTDIIANYQRGLVADLEGIGNRNDTRKPFRIQEPTRVVIRKDAQECGTVTIAPRAGGATVVAAATPAAMPAGPAPAPRILDLLVEVAGTERTVAPNGTLRVARGSRIVIKGLRTSPKEMAGRMEVNLKGFAPKRGPNDGNDLDTPISFPADLMSRFSENRAGRRYPVEASLGQEVLGRFWLEVAGR